MNNKTYEEGYAVVNDLKMYYQIHGSGKTPLILIHGGGSTIETSFGRLLPLLSKNRQTVAVELQAHGRTGDRNAPVTFEQDADDVAGLLKHLNIERAHILGFSNGGSTAMQIAIRHPRLVDKLVVVSSFYKREGLVPGFFEMMENATLDNMPAPLKTAYLNVAEDKNGLQTMHDKDKARMLTFRDWPEESLRSIKAPSLLAIADQDVVTPEHAVEMSRLIPNARLMVLPGVHGSFIGEVCTAKEGGKLPELTAAAIEEFLNE